jgi:hypothetical protein
MNTSQNSTLTYSILVGVDYSANGDLAVERAFELGADPEFHAA